MINKNELLEVQKILRKNLSNSIKDRHKMKKTIKHLGEKTVIDPFSRLCSIISDLNLLIKEVENGRN